MKLPKGPALKLPGRGKSSEAGSAASPGTGRPGIQAPPFATDLYRDLRDRRLLIPALVLIIALIAVPVALKQGEEPTVPLGASPAAPEAATAVEPAVLTEQLGGVRDYRKRLDALNRTNPFDQKYLVPTPKGETVENVETTSIADVGASDPAPSGPAPDLGSTGATSSGAQTTVDPAPASNPPPAKPDEKKVVYVYEPRIDAVVGYDGKRKKYESVRPGKLLPDRSTPIAMFLWAPKSLETARFVLSSDVVATSGEGHCAPGPADCQFLKLADGEKRVIEYASGPAAGVGVAEKYSLKVTSISRVLVKKTKSD